MESLNEQLQGINTSFQSLIPELILLGGILVILTASLFARGHHLTFNILTCITTGLSLWSLTTLPASGTLSLFNGMLKREAFGGFLMILVDASVLLTCLMSFHHAGKKKLAEYYSLLLAIALGSHLLLMTTNLLMVFISLELISISSYILAGYAFTRTASEGSLKYFLFGSVASAIMLYGFSFLYGMSGTLDFGSEIFFTVLASNASALPLIAGLMALSGFLFKMAAVPMHLWTPDVYEAAPIPVIALLSVAPKLAAIGALTKFVLSMHLFGQSGYDWQIIVAVIVILTITVGNLSALWQKNPKRMMAYSSIAHSGFLLVSVAAFAGEALPFMLFYASVYLLMNFAVFFYLAFFERQGAVSMATFSGKGKTFTGAAIGLTMALIALTGLPPTAGFTAKLLVFSGVWKAYQETDKTLLLWVLVIGLLNTVVSLFYYLRIPYYAFLKAGDRPGVEKNGSFENFLGAVLVVVVVIIFFIPGLLMGLINRINFVL